jgi:hypothetical protein
VTTDEPVVARHRRSGATPLVEAVVLGVFTFVMAFLAGVIARSTDVAECSYAVIAANAGIAAGLAFAAWLILSAVRR